MAESKSVFSDNEYTIMAEILDNENITQRELSKKLDISVSTVNVLINKMIREGLIKMTLVSQKQVFYMLTPVGLMEKAKKTVSYLRAHYKAIYETKEKIKAVLEDLKNNHDVIFILMNDDEMSKVMGIALDELDKHHGQSKVIVVDRGENLDYNGFHSPVLVHMMESEEALQVVEEDEGLVVINLMERV